MKKILGNEFIQKFEEFAPKSLAENGDPVGLQIGTLNKTIKRILVTLDVRPEVVAEAIEQNVDLIFAHHPPIFRGAKNLVIDNPQNKMYAELLKHDIAVYAAHTNLDVATNGLNDWLGQAIGLDNTEIMSISKQESYKKMAAYVPKSHKKQVREALTAAGAGKIGPNYAQCSYTLDGVGRFTPINNALPAIGELNQAEEVNEAKVEVIFPQRLTESVERALFSSHPYEEPAYDLYTIENFVDSYGFGRVGNLAEPITVLDFATKLKTIFSVSGLRVVTATPEKMIQRVAICGGSAGDYYLDAKKHGADVYITGDVYYHTAHDMLASGMTVIDPGHHIESICIAELADLFTEWSQTNHWDIEIVQSTLNTDPFTFI
ncbi:Nif3-like dinuclear metal center hexameric protein [Carnobacterium maltaromaticum]|uniref:Nif3-like dinuclear metal center hexameric protein n=1 Tax=Carnobacterium maltaromaticum TaxID=2751 RepID=UPI00026C89E3|nr:Nif3-like dinuclear metal center hexameric protein [Carnobacterium maltaromaticum]